MGIFNNKNWISKRVNSYLKMNHKSLYEPFHKNFLITTFNFLSEKEQWWFVLLFVLSVFGIGSFITFESLQFITLTSETSKILVDQRTTNVATIISITLVVVGFLINNLAVKSEITYKLLFKSSFLYPTIYLTLSTIGSFIIVSTIRDTSIPNFNYSNAVIAGTFLVFLILLLIGFLFRTIIQFTNDREIANLLHRQFIKEAKTLAS